ncbi:Gfo/Idh/MocA family oxidoreductase [Streptomyces sp. WMMB 322]|uniref:Gfo/Idh/MocA family oxidoreductase n=1 Tax=Streptomyces sp. WMMB 322 TaxID=1286821 RepID=UPI0006E450CE|nr:Gfo/Idh/MocA family oxidoreductase [Streptomyces sp. WMMB 322]SCK20212.1 Predicted dehydrogenase [Streptomyces sp. WMMB 322]
MDRTESAAPPPLRVGLIGYGLAGSVFHAPLISATEGLTLDTVVTAVRERQAQVQAEFGDTRTLGTTEELFARADALDLVVVASPNRTHVALARQALQAGLPVVVDKPLAGTADEAQQLASLAAERGLMLSAFHNRRWDNDFLTVRALLADGTLGDRIHRFESRYERWRPQLKGGWRESGDPDEVGGLLYDLGSHLVDQALTLFGPATSVYAETDLRRAGAEVDDDAFIALTHADGVRSHLWMSAVAARLGPRFRVLGSEAAYVKDGLDPQEAALREGARPARGQRWGVEPEADWGTVGDLHTHRPVPTLDGDYPAYYKGIVAALRGGTRPPVTADEAVATIRVLEAARTSALESRVVTPDFG